MDVMECTRCVCMCQGIPDVPWMSWDVPGVYVCVRVLCVRVSLTYHGCIGQQPTKYDCVSEF